MVAPEQVYGVQLHLHGSLSEGPGSMRGHHEAAAALDGAVDVIWWTDHDWRIAGHSAVEAFDFESGLMEEDSVPAPLLAAQWDGRESRSGRTQQDAGMPREPRESVQKGWRRVRVGRAASRARFEGPDRETRAGQRSLHVHFEGLGRRRSEGKGEGKAAARGAQWEQALLQFESSRRRHVASLASRVRLGLSVLPTRVDEDARLILRVQLSQQPPNEQVGIDYVLKSRRHSRSDGMGGAPTAPALTRVVRGIPAPGIRTARRAVIEVFTEPGVWNDLVFDVSSDAIAHELGGLDNSLVEIYLVAQVRRTGRLDVFVDSFLIEREQLGADLFEEQKRLAGSLEQDGIIHHVGQEISYAAHLNAYGPDVPLADSDAHPHGYTPVEAVLLAHRHRGLVSLNHLFGVGTGMVSHLSGRGRVAFDRTLERLISQGAYGVDLLEVGYRERGYGLEAFVELWDRLASAGIRLTGIGVSDSHDNDVGWQRGPNNFITWVLARSASQQDLLDGLRRGRAFFGDPTRFDGRLDLEIEGRARMGEVLELPPGRVRVKLYAEGLRPDQSVRLVQGGNVLRTWKPTLADWHAQHELLIDGRDFVRFEVHDRAGPVAFTNPLYFVLESAQETLRDARRP
jgi:hypothetical protein